MRRPSLLSLLACIVLASPSAPALAQNSFTQIDLVSDLCGARVPAGADFCRVTAGGSTIGGRFIVLH